MFRMRRVVAIIFLGLMVLCGSVYAACYNDCTPLPDCARMGYKLESEIFCPDGAITCPFDSHYKWCKEYKCEDGRYSDNETLTGERGFRCDAVEYHKRQCFYCRCDPNPEECKWSNLNKGYGEISDGCCDGHFATCKSLCENTVKVPENATGITEPCTGCGVKVDIITSWVCNKWWVEYKGACLPRPCENGYTITEPSLESCGEQGLGAAGWTWESQGYMGHNICGKCTAKSCLEGFSTDYPTVGKCGKTGANGWDWQKSEQYAGDEICGKCTEKQCPDGYKSGVASVNDCGKQGEGGWQYEQSTTSNGDSACGKCTPKQCPKDSAVDVKDCGTQGAAGYSLGAHAGWNGEDECKTCDPLTCEPNTATTESGCGETGNKGWSLGTSTGRYNGETACKNCVMLDCPKDSQTEWSDATKCGSNGKMNGWTSEGIDNYNGETQCFKCSKKKCAEGYDTNKPDVGSCGTSGGWDWSQNGYSGDDVCGKCTAKTCPSEYQTDAASCGSGVGRDSGWQLDKNQTCQAGNTTKYKCVKKTCSHPNALNVDGCGTKGGWTIGTTASCWAGDTAYYPCTKVSCPAGQSTEYKDPNKCPTTGSKGYTSSTSGSYNGNDACYKCEPKKCGLNESTDSTTQPCGAGGDSGWNREQTSNYNGDNPCYICTAKGCPQDESTSNDVSVCGVGGANGWSRDATSNYAGNTQCYKCTIKTCPEGDTDSAVTSCGSSGADGWTKPATGKYNGNSPCYKCTAKTCSAKDEPPVNATCTEHCTTGDETICVKWSCNQGYTKVGEKCNVTQCPNNSAISASKCGTQGEKGWTLGASNGTWSGSDECKICTPKPCSQGDISDTDVSKCDYLGTIGASKTANGAFSGDNACYDCACNAPAGCTWKKGEEGTGSLSKPCCNGHYQSCQSNCVEKKEPLNGTCTAWCTGCGNRVCTDWKCNDGYVNSNGTCAPAQCPAGFNTQYQTEANCPEGSGWKVTFNGKSGETPCGQCVCEPASNCIWDNNNKGNATLNNLCCNKMYASCTSTCQVASKIENADCSKTCKGCNNEAVCVEYSCKTGYTKVNGVCLVNKCPSGSGTTVSDCGTHAEGWELGSNTGVQSANGACKTCQAKSCQGGSSTSYQSVNDCTTNSCAYYQDKGYSGDNKCGLCYYSVDVEIPANAKCSETTKCDKGSYCSKWECNTGYINSNGTCVLHEAGCVESKEPAHATCKSHCYTYGSYVCKNWACDEGYTQSGSTCVPAQCPQGSSTTLSTSNCHGGTHGAYVEKNGSYSGSSPCYECKCSASDCKWNSSNAGKNGQLSTECCDGYYLYCNKPSPVSIPQNASCSSYYDACGDKNICASWRCNSNYIESGNGCVRHDSGCSSVDVPLNGYCSSHCYSYGSYECESWDCDSGYHASGNTCVPDCTATCGSRGLKYSPPSCQTGETYDTETVCGSTCYTDCECTSPCSDVYIPNNAHGTSTKSACGKKCYTDWACNSGYHAVGSTCVEDCTKTCTSENLLNYKPTCQTGETTTQSTVCGQTCYSQCECTSPCKSVDMPTSAYGTNPIYACGKTCYTDWACPAGFTKTSTSCEPSLSGSNCIQCTSSNYECTRSLGGRQQIQCSDSKLSGYTCVECLTVDVGEVVVGGEEGGW